MRNNKILVISAGEAYQTVFIDLYIRFLGARKYDARYMELYEDLGLNDGKTILVDKIFELHGVEPEELFGLLSMSSCIFFGNYSKLTKEEFEFSKLPKNEKVRIINEDEYGLLSLNTKVLANFHPGEIKIYGEYLENQSFYPSNTIQF